MFLECAIVFVATAAADYFWVQYVSAISKHSAGLAALWSSAIVMVNAAAIVVYVREPATIGAAVAGAFLGTYLSVRRMK
jgi:hypothetical protein